MHEFAVFSGMRWTTKLLGVLAVVAWAVACGEKEIVYEKSPAENPPAASPGTTSAPPPTGSVYPDSGAAGFPDRWAAVAEFTTPVPIWFATDRAVFPPPLSWTNGRLNPNPGDEYPPQLAGAWLDIDERVVVIASAPAPATMPTGMLVYVAYLDGQVLNAFFVPAGTELHGVQSSAGNRERFALNLGTIDYNDLLILGSVGVPEPLAVIPNVHATAASVDGVLAADNHAFFDWDGRPGGTFGATEVASAIGLTDRALLYVPSFGSLSISPLGGANMTLSSDVSIPDVVVYGHDVVWRDAARTTIFTANLSATPTATVVRAAPTEGIYPGNVGGGYFAEPTVDGKLRVVRLDDGRQWLPQDIQVDQLRAPLFMTDTEFLIRNPGVIDDDGPASAWWDHTYYSFQRVPIAASDFHP